MDHLATGGTGLSKQWAIQAQHLSKSFGTVQAAIDVAISLEPGRFMALLGPSGCGKTTVLRMLAGFETPDQGTIEIEGRAVSGPGVWVPPEQRRIGMVFQEYALFPHLTVQANVEFGLPADSPSRRERTQEVLKLVGLEGVRNRMPHELSGGQQQRVALARALAPRPALILLDEPFSNLDAALRDRVRQEVRSILRQAGATALFVTHDQEEALSLADEIAVMIDGRIMQSDRPERLYRRPATHQVATFLGDANFLPGKADGESVECELGKLAILEPQQGEVELMFRPEDLILTPDEQGPGEIIERTYFGHDQMLKIRLDSSTILRSRLVGCCRGMHEGHRVRVHIETPIMAYPSRYGCPVDKVTSLA